MSVGTQIAQVMVNANAEGLLRAAIFFQNQLRMRFSRKTNDYANSNPSQPGEYPAVISGFLRDNILYEPTTPREIGFEGAVRVGYGANAIYGPILELQRKRLGLLHALGDLSEQLSGQWAGGVDKAGNATTST